MDSPTTFTEVLIPEEGAMLALLGQHDAHLRRIEQAFPSTRIIARGTRLLLSGDAEQTARAHRVLSQLKELADTGEPIDADRVDRVITMVEDGVAHPAEVLSGGVPVAGGKMVRPKTAGQRHYLDAIAEHTITFGIGPAGTGKTYLAVAAAVEALRSGLVRRIILTRPAVEAGERLGFLPGDLAAKIDPYLRPLYDALYDMLGTDETSSLLERNTIEVAPLAYMRGRTLNDAFIILDEAQNTSPEQMKMFLTRLGFNSRMVVTGDVTQVDLPTGNRSGLNAVRRVLEGIEGIAFIDLTGKDVVRAKIVRDIVAAYEALETR
ncbi:MAG: PhoH family protein [Acidimicrobiia bacterium]